MEKTTYEQDIFFDPFSEGNEDFNPEDLFEAIFAKYQNNEVEHDYTADNFVKDTEALMLDARFTEQFSAFESIAARMHQLCADDHSLSSAMENSSLFGASQKHDSHDGHSHGHDEENDHRPTGKKKKKKKSHHTHTSHETKNRTKLSFDDIIKMFLRTKALPKKP